MVEVFEEGSDSPLLADKLLIQIDEQRNLLYILAHNRSLVDPDVVQMSQKLDRLLNLYNDLMTDE